MKKYIYTTLFILIGIGVFNTAKAGTATYNFNNYLGNESRYDYSTSTFSQFNAGQTYQFECIAPTLTNQTDPHEPQQIYINGDSSWPSVPSISGSSSTIYIFTANTNLSTNNFIKLFYGGLNNGFINCHNPDGKLIISDDGNFETISYTNPTQNETIQGRDAQWFDYTFTNFTNDAVYSAIAYYATPNESTLYDWQSEQMLIYDSNVTNGTAMIQIPQNLFIPEFGTSTHWKTYTELYKRTSSTDTLVYTTPYIDFVVIKPFSTSTTSANETTFRNGRLEDKNGYIIDRLGRYLDLDGNVTSTPVLNPKAPYQEQNYCATDTGSIIHDWGCMFYNAGQAIFNWLFEIPDWAKDYFNNTITEIQGYFPFSIVYGTINNIKTGLNTTSANNITLDIPQIGLNNITIISTSTLQTEIGTTTFNQYYSTFQKVLWVMAGIGSIAIIIL